jgi:FkbM family methyltransferase
MLPPCKCILAQNEFGSYCVPNSSSHRPAAKRILNGQVYEPKTLEFMLRNAGIGDIVHAGAYFGDFLPALSRSVASDCIVWAFEPNSDSHTCATWTIEINRLHNVRLSSAGLSDRSRGAKLQISTPEGIKLGGASRLVDGDNASAVSNEKEVFEEIRLITIDEAVPRDRRITILQLDIEGHETAALYGGLETIKNNKPLIILETWNGSDGPMRILKPLGYDVQLRFEFNTVFSVGG